MRPYLWQYRPIKKDVLAQQALNTAPETSNTTFAESHTMIAADPIQFNASDIEEIDLQSIDSDIEEIDVLPDDSNIEVIDLSCELIYFYK